MSLWLLCRPSCLKKRRRRKMCSQALVSQIHVVLFLPLVFDLFCWRYLICWVIRDIKQVAERHDIFKMLYLLSWYYLTINQWYGSKGTGTQTTVGNWCCFYNMRPVEGTKGPAQADWRKNSGGNRGNRGGLTSLTWMQEACFRYGSFLFSR